MSDIVKGLRTFLLTKSSVTTTTGTRVYFGNLPQRPTYPNLVLHLIDSETQRHLGNAAGLARSEIQVDVHSESPLTAEATSEAVRKVTEHYTGAWGSETVRSSYVTGRRDLEEPPIDASARHRYVRSLDLVVWHTEALPST